MYKFSAALITILIPAFVIAETPQAVPTIAPIPTFKLGVCGEPRSLYQECGAGEGWLPGLNRTIPQFLASNPSQIRCPKDSSYSKVTGSENDTTLGVDRTFFQYVCCCLLPGVITQIEEVSF